MTFTLKPMSDRRFKPWTKEEVATLKEMVGTYQAKEIAAHLGRSVIAVKHTARKNGVSLSVLIRPYTPQEDKWIKQLAGTHQASEIARKLNRTTKSVKYRASILKVSLAQLGDNHPRVRISDDDVEEARTLHDQGVSPKEIMTLLGLTVDVASLRRILRYESRVGAMI